MPPGTMVSGLEIKSVEWKEKYLIEVQTIEMVEGFILTLILLAIKTAQNLELSLALGGHTHGSDFRRVLSCFGISHVRRPTLCFVLRAWALV